MSNFLANYKSANQDIVDLLRQSPDSKDSGQFETEFWRENMHGGLEIGKSVIENINGDWEFFLAINEVLTCSYTYKQVSSMHIERSNTGNGEYLFFNLVLYDTVLMEVTYIRYAARLI